MTNCEFCSTYGEFICKKCFDGHAIKHDSDITCEGISSLENNNFYSNDSNINFYSCQLYNDAINCEECSSKEICTKCQTGYSFYNDDTLCANNDDIENNLFVWISGNILKSCSSLIKDCNKCTDSKTCINCKEGTGLIDDNTCLSETIIENNKNYYYDASTQKYISCSVIENCLTCVSSTVCTSCKSGFKLNNNICNEDEDDDKLSTGAIIGIVFGCLGFLLILALIVYFLFKKYFKKNNGDNNNNDDRKDENYNDEIDEEGIEKIPYNEAIIIETENQKQIQSSIKRRSIHNK